MLVRLTYYVSKLMDCFTGDAGRHIDGGVLSNSGFGQNLENDDLHIPPSQPLPGFPYQVVMYFWP